MSSTAFAIKDFMTVKPHAVEPHEPIDVALRRMRQLKVLHMPVRAAGKAVGMLSERDLGALEALCRKTGKASELAAIKVMDVMTPEPYRVRPEAGLAQVAQEMADQKIGSALVVDEQGSLVGIFTATDALRALAALS